jgi:hypothetical protein
MEGELEQTRATVKSLRVLGDEKPPPKIAVVPGSSDREDAEVVLGAGRPPGCRGLVGRAARLREDGIVLLGGGADEAPEVYRRLPEVLAAHGDTIRVRHTLRPLGAAMAGRDVPDPYKD